MIGKYKDSRYKHSFEISFGLLFTELWFINQTHLKTIEGQEGEAIEIVCSCDTEQYITALTLKSNGTIKAIGDNQTVSYSFTPDRSDHLTKYQCVDSKHSSIMIEVELSIKYAPVVACHLTNTTITCDCDGIPKNYSVYRLDQISRNGELVRSVNLNTEIFTFRTDPFPYQKNGIYTCFVSNGIPDTTGKVLQNCSTNVTYEGPPVFSPRNRHVKHGEVGISISMSFYIYSYPAVDEVNIEKIGQKQNKFEKLKTYNILKSTLLYTEFDNAVGVEGYEILIESEVLKIDDFHAYLIIAKNHLGESKYRFEIIDQESLPLAKGKRIMFVIVCCIASILLVYLTITHVCVCVKHVKTRNQRLQNLQEDHLYHTYDEIGTISFRAVSSLHSADIIDNLGQNPTGEHTHNVSVDVNLQSTTDYTTELNAGFLNDGLQREITDVHGQGRSLSLLDTNFSNTDVSSISFTGISRIKNFSNCNQTSRNTDRSREQKSKTCKTCNNSRSWSSNDVMVGNVKNEYENKYQLQDGHQYLETLDDRQFKISATDYSTKNHQKSQTSNDSRPSNNAMVGKARNEYENNYQLQDGNLYFETLDDGQISIPSTTDSIVKIQQRSQTISDASSGSSDKSRIGNVRNEYENNYQLQDGNLYIEVLDDRPITLSSTDSIAKTHQRSQTISDAASESTSNAMVGNERNEYENNNQMQDGHLYLDILDDRPITLSSTDSIAKNQTRSQTISDADSVSSNNAMVDNVRNEYENNYQLQDGKLYFDILDDSQNIISATDYSTNKQKQSQTSDDFNSGSSNNFIVDNVGDVFENPYQMILQDQVESHPYTEIIRERHSGTPSTESEKTEKQRAHPGSAKE
ncbi:Hypothetical predicted protein [Mytilus galloprovincialis]|uniref:Ig-like domain-containing protein n=1 Tax=Mytilus galloprovincialis TaxID=29158 RepID=A0A8B6ESR8_MYTGA|nr:Hypothetical predicted protein [Mytilus galloprovincialis]